MEQTSVNVGGSPPKRLWRIVAGLVVIVSTIVFFTVHQRQQKANFDVNVAQADTLFAADKFSEAKQYYQTALQYRQDTATQAKVSLCEQLDGSFYEFRKGTDLFGKKDYLGAYRSFKQVISEDTKHYSLAQQQGSQAAKLYIDQELQRAAELAVEQDYNQAIMHLYAVQSVDPNNEQAYALSLQYHSLLDKKTTNDKLQKDTEEARSIIRVSSIYASRPNSAGGVDLHITWTNNSAKTVKYATFEVVPYNAVGDKVSCEIRHNSNFSGKDTGPVAPGQTRGNSDGYWENAWYNYSITNVKLVGIYITYMDGSSSSLTEPQVGYAVY